MILNPMSQPDKRLFPSEAFLEAAKLTRPKAALQKVYVYVEDDIDKVFWRRFLEASGTDFEFSINVYRVLGKEQRGKDAMMKAVEDGTLPLSKYVLLCLDSDLDLIVDNYHTYTETFRKSPYIINTVWYAMENLKCAPRNVKDMLYMVTLASDLPVDVSAKFNSISQLIQDLFLMCLVSYKYKDSYYPLTSLRSSMQLLAFDGLGDVTKESKRQLRVEIGKHKKYISSHKTEIEAFKKKLSGTQTTDNYLCYIRGHDLVDVIIKPFTVSICGPSRTERLKNIGGCKMDKEHKSQLHQQYCNQSGINDRCSLSERIDNLIRDCYNFEGLPVYSSIISQIKTAFVSGTVAGILNGIISHKSV